MPHQVQVLDLDIERLVKSGRQRAANPAIPIGVDGRERAMRVQDYDLFRTSRTLLLGKARHCQRPYRAGESENATAPAIPRMLLE